MKDKTIGRLVLAGFMIALLIWVVWDLWEQDTMHNMTCEQLWFFGQEIKDSSTASRHSHVVAHLVTDCYEYWK